VSTGIAVKHSQTAFSCAYKPDVYSFLIIGEKPGESDLSGV